MKTTSKKIQKRSIGDIWIVDKGGVEYEYTKNKDGKTVPVRRVTPYTHPQRRNNGETKAGGPKMGDNNTLRRGAGDISAQPKRGVKQIPSIDHTFNPQTMHMVQIDHRTWVQRPKTV